MRAFFLLATIFITLSANPQWTLAAKGRNEINVEITSHLGDEQDFYAGDAVNFLVSINRDAYLLVVYQTADNQLIQLHPNTHTQRKKHKAGVYFPIPNARSSYQFIVAPPFGQETVWVFASSKPFPDYPGKALKSGLKRLSGKTQFTLRRIQSHANKSKFGEHFFRLTTHPSP